MLHRKRVFLIEKKWSSVNARRLSTTEGNQSAICRISAGFFLRKKEK